MIEARPISLRRANERKVAQNRAHAKGVHHPALQLPTRKLHAAQSETAHNANGKE